MGGASRFITLLTAPFPLLLHRHPRPFLLCLSRLRSSSLSSVRPLSSSSLSPLSRSQLCSPIKSSQNFHIQSSSSTVQDDHFGVSPNTPPSHPWSEWSKFIDTLSSCGHFYHQIQAIGSEDEFVAYEQVSEEFVRASSACLAFARQRSDLLRLLSRRDIVVVVENGTPFLFKSSLDTARRMRTFLTTGDNVMESDKAHTVDLMKYLLSYASNPAVSSDRGGLYRGELLESSVRNLFSELARLCSGAPEPDSSMQFNFADRHGQTPRPLGPKIEMKRGDWICPKCNFMNFARNMSCLECEESRPKRQLTGGEWECPQCDFFNYGRNQVCLRCDCKRPGEASFGANSTSGLGYSNVAYANKPEIDSRLAANEEKAQRWFSKISQMDGASDLSSAAADEDFPEIMPLRKGENRFVVSTRKTALERRLANSQYQRNLGNEFQTKEANTPINRSLNEILGCDADKKNTNETQNAGVDSSSPLSTAASPNYGHSKGSNSNYVPFVPFPDDMFANKPQNLKIEDSEKMTTECIKHMSPLSNENASSGRESEKSAENTQLSEMPLKQDKSPDKENELAEKSERWFKKVAELHDIKDLSAISDEDFPDIMPMRKGENRFVVSKKKDRSLTSPMYKRKMAMEQTGNTNFVPFVPFPSDYFAKKDNQPDGSDPSSKAATETSSSSVIPNSSDNKRDSTSDINHMTRMDDRSLESSGVNLKSGNSMQNSFVSQSSNDDTGRTADYSGNASTKDNTNFTGNSTKQPGNENFRTEWKGKSLEGSAVQEPDPLDMSEEAKAQRWFRRVAQIKDISELSQIPDEDFPSIMPMRKGVNRFVVSKRKTPLERRLTSPQYRRNLPIVRSDPLKKENEDS